MVYGKGEVLRDTCLSLPLFSPAKALHFSSAWFWVCVLYPTCESGLARPFPRRSDALPCSWSGHTELARGRGLHTETPPIFKMETVSAVLRTSQPRIFLQFCLKEPHQGFVLFSSQSWWPVPCHSQLWEWLSSCPFPAISQKCSLPRPLLGVLGHRNQCVGPGFSFSGRSCEQPRCLKRHFGLTGAA